jgi:Kdo2-lipid IVA lauroyltransferase/acyltransferase
MSLFLRLAARVPLPILHVAGAAAGWLVYGVSPRFRKYLSGNLAQAGYARCALRRAAVGETGKAVLELPAVWLREHEESASLVRDVQRWQLVQQAMAEGKGLVLLTPHLGCWEVSAQYFSRHYPLTVLYSPPKLRSLEPLMRRGRTRELLKSVPADLSGVRALYRALKRGEAIGMLPDQVPGVGEGEWTEFFGRPAYTMTLAMRMAGSIQCPVLMAYAERLPRGRGFRIHIDALPPRSLGETPARHMNRALETLIRRCPAQYLWAYNRYKVPAGVAAPEPAVP